MKWLLLRRRRGLKAMEQQQQQHTEQNGIHRVIINVPVMPPAASATQPWWPQHYDNNEDDDNDEDLQAAMSRSMMHAEETREMGKDSLGMPASTTQLPSQNAPWNTRAKFTSTVYPCLMQSSGQTTKTKTTTWPSKLFFAMSMHPNQEGRREVPRDDTVKESVEKMWNSGQPFDPSSFRAIMWDDRVTTNDDKKR